MSDINRSYRETLQNLDLLYDYINVMFFGGELLPALITLEVEETNRRGYYQFKSPYGRYVPIERINLNPLHFNSEEGWETPARTLLHECIHQYARSVGIVDYESGKHTADFKRVAEQHGMKVIDVPDPDKGYYFATLNDSSKRLLLEFCKDFAPPFAVGASRIS